ncbi:putative metal-binding cluster containing protein [cyanobiont of Ornithocercus magnificus]|nr:putative metal-binding cluster containing protein [cyanobiont of Ornithocercus magnificus]
MCICVNCRWVDRCQTYHAVERQHGVPHLSGSPDLMPVSPRVHISVTDLPDGGTGIEWDVQACDSFASDLGRWQRLRPGEICPQ